MKRGRLIWLLAGAGALIVGLVAAVLIRVYRDPIAALGGVVLRYQVDADHPWPAPTGDRPAVVRRAAEVLGARAGRMKAWARARVDGEQVRVELPRATAGEAREIERILAMHGWLEFQIVDDNSDYMRALAAQVAASPESFPEIEVGHDQWTGPAGRLLHEDLFLRARSREPLDRFIAAPPPGRQPPPDRFLALEQSIEHDLNGMETARTTWRTYLLRRDGALTGDDVAEADWSRDSNTQRPEVAITFSDRGARRFAELTEANVGRKLAILLDGKVSSAPVLESAITGGRARITLGGTGTEASLRQEAIDLTAVLRSGGLPAPVKLLDEATR